MTTVARVTEIASLGDPRLFASISINGVEVRGLLDSGASVSCVGADASETLRECGLTWKRQSDKVRVANGQQQQIRRHVDASVTFRGITKRIQLFVIPTLCQKLYLGIDFWRSFGLVPQLDDIAVDGPVLPNVHVLNATNQAKLDAVKATFPTCEKEGLGKTSLLKNAIDVGGASQQSSDTTRCLLRYSKRCGQSSIACWS